MILDDNIESVPPEKRASVRQRIEALRAQMREVEDPVEHLALQAELARICREEGLSPDVTWNK